MSPADPSVRISRNDAEQRLSTLRAQRLTPVEKRNLIDRLDYWQYSSPQEVRDAIQAGDLPRMQDELVRFVVDTAQTPDSLPELVEPLVLDALLKMLLDKQISQQRLCLSRRKA